MDDFFKDLLVLLNPESPYFNKNILAHIILKHGVFYQERIDAKDESIIDGVVAEALISLEMERDFTERFSLQLKEQIEKELKNIK